MLFWLLISIALISTVWAMLGAVLVPISDPDVWWVAAAGRQMLETHSVQRTNLFSFTDPQQPWIMHEWLLGPLYATGLTQLGPPVFIVMAIGVLALGLALLTQATLLRARQPLAGALLLCTGALFFLRRLQTARPTAVALLLPLSLCTLAFGPRFGRGHVLGSVLIVWLWTNCHGSFPLGVVLLLAAALEQPQDRARRLFAAAAAAAVSLLNPYGLALHRFVYGYFRGDSGIYREIHAHIHEFGNIVAGWGKLIDLPELLGFLAILGLSGAAAFDRRYRLRALICLGLCAMAARQSRHLELAGLLTSMLLVPWADAWVERALPRLAAAVQDGPQLRRRAAALVLAPTLLTACGAFAHDAITRQPEGWIASEYAYMSAVRELPADTRVYVPFSVGGLAIWRGYPRGVRVFYDSRNDCYRAETLRAFHQLGIGASADETRRLLDESRTNTVLVPSDHPLSKTLLAAPEWDSRTAGTARLFQRRDQGAARAPESAAARPL